MSVVWSSRSAGPPQMNPQPSIREIAREAGFSTWSVSRALNERDGIAPATRASILDIARRLGYRPNPLVSAVMARNRSCRDRVVYNGNLAIVSACRPDRQPLPFHERTIHAACDRASELGFRMETFLLGESGLTVSRLNQILLARGIHGILDLPWNEPRDLSGLDWSLFSAARMVYSWGSPELNVVSPDYHLQFLQALYRLDDMGYRRIGLCLYLQNDQRVLYKWEAAFLLFQSLLPEARRIPALLQPDKDPARFYDWLGRWDPDLVVSYSHRPLSWLRRSGCRVPEERGFFSLNIDAGESDCAGLDLNPALVGKVATDTLVAQIHRNEKGLCSEPFQISVPGKFRYGPTLRPGGEGGDSSERDRPMKLVGWPY